jgi:hypothetical protein
MKEVHSVEKIDTGLSNYYVVEEVQSNFRGMEVICWNDPTEFAETLKEWARKVNLKRFLSSPRGEKKPVKKSKSDRKTPHVASFRLLAGR